MICPRMLASAGTMLSVVTSPVPISSARAPRMDSMIFRGRVFSRSIDYFVYIQKSWLSRISHLRALAVQLQNATPPVFLDECLQFPSYLGLRQNYSTCLIQFVNRRPFFAKSLLKVDLPHMANYCTDIPISIGLSSKAGLQPADLWNLAVGENSKKSLRGVARFSNNQFFSFIGSNFWIQNPAKSNMIFIKSTVTGFIFPVTVLVSLLE